MKIPVLAPGMEPYREALAELPIPNVMVIGQCNISVMNRGGFDKPDFDSLIAKFDKETIEKLKKNSIETPLIDISSTEIRRKLADDEDAGEFLHPEVLKYIKDRRLYMPNESLW